MTEAASQETKFANFDKQAKRIRLKIKQAGEVHVNTPQNIRFSRKEAR